MQSSLSLVTYQIDKARYTNHGPIIEQATGNESSLWTV